jgi:integrase/recombinase XerC
MPRPPKPWYRTDRDAWYVKIVGKPVLLARGKDAKADAQKAFHRLMVERADGRTRPTPARLLSGEVIARYLAHLDRRVESGELATSSWRDADDRTKAFVARWGAVPCDELVPADVDGWIRSEPSWGPTRRHDVAGAIKAAFRWAAHQGVIPADPLARLSKPSRRGRRDLTLTAETWKAAVAEIRSSEFASLMEFIHSTGCRPSEACRLEARHLDFERGIAVLTGKTTARTGRQRVIPLPGRIVEGLRERARQRSTGALWRTEDGNPWSKDSINCQIRRLRARLKAAGVEGADRIVAYELRHLFATDALEAGVQIATVAEILGHSDTRMVSRNYGHLADRHEHLRAAVEVVRPGEAR